MRAPNKPRGTSNSARRGNTEDRRRRREWLGSDCNTETGAQLGAQRAAAKRGVA